MEDMAIFGKDFATISALKIYQDDDLPQKTQVRQFEGPWSPQENQTIHPPWVLGLKFGLHQTVLCSRDRTFVMATGFPKHFDTDLGMGQNL